MVRSIFLLVIFQIGFISAGFSQKNAYNGVGINAFYANHYGTLEGQDDWLGNETIDTMRFSSIGAQLMFYLGQSWGEKPVRPGMGTYPSFGIEFDTRGFYFDVPVLFEVYADVNDHFLLQTGLGPTYTFLLGNHDFSGGSIGGKFSLGMISRDASLPIAVKFTYGLNMRPKFSDELAHYWLTGRSHMVTFGAAWIMQ